MSTPAQASVLRSSIELRRPPAPRTLRALAMYLLRLGPSGFGGPIALVVAGAALISIIAVR
jgi:hypothetical protein